VTHGSETRKFRSQISKLPRPVRGTARTISHVHDIGGGCKESFTAYEDCEGNTIECTEKWLKLKKCMEVHIDYYQPYYSMWKKVDELEERNRIPVYPAKEPKERAKQASEFVRGPCKEPLRSFKPRDAEYTRNNNTLTFHRLREALDTVYKSFDTVYKCMEAHSDYNQYEAFLTSMKRRDKYYDKEFDAFLA
ncbi:unnamed protein product, partial [Arabidopsis halleri]